MRAVTYQGAKDIQVKEVEDPKLQKNDDIIVKHNIRVFSFYLAVRQTIHKN